MNAEIAMAVEAFLNDPDLKAAIIGVIGTLIGTILGTILGWILGKIDMGRLRIAFDNTTYEFAAIEGINYIRDDRSKVEYSYSLSTTIQLHNSSNINQVLRNVQIIFTDGKHDLLILDAKDNGSKEFAAASYHYSNLEIANIQPHMGMNIKIHIYSTDIDKISRTKKIFIQYKDRNFKKKRVFLKAVDYSKQVHLSEGGKDNA